VWVVVLVMLAGFAVSFGIEQAQAYLPTRNSSLLDLMTNVVGTAFGVIAACLAGRHKFFSGKIFETQPSCSINFYPVKYTAGEERSEFNQGNEPNKLNEPKKLNRHNKPNQLFVTSQHSLYRFLCSGGWRFLGSAISTDHTISRRLALFALYSDPTV
jgi:hypothetical protein